MPEDMEGADRAPIRVQPMPEDMQGECLNRAFSTPYNNSEPQEDSEDTDKDTDVYESEVQCKIRSMSLRWRRSHVCMYLS